MTCVLSFGEHALAAARAHCSIARIQCFIQLTLPQTTLRGLHECSKGKRATGVYPVFECQITSMTYQIISTFTEDSRHVSLQVVAANGSTPSARPSA